MCYIIAMGGGLPVNARQKRFCDEYLVDCNATQAAIRAGYSAKTAKQVGQRLLTYVDLKFYIERELERLHNERTANAEEVMEYLTAVMRGEPDEGCEEPLVVQGTEVTTRDRLKAAELIGKRYGLFKEGLEVSGAVPVVIAGEAELEE